jgi:3-hydroxyacyl-CoA dehydrogenase/3a,7a,12a-trihydroxy-5b-cholest-24-enoyl-CoA hydratase
MSELRFDDRVVVVTGAGNGLGRSHAHLFASRGARVVVNDLGGSFDGAGASSKAADVVVQEIKDAGGEAVANYDSVTDGDKIIQTAMDTWGRVDVVVNNAGILRDKSFHKMSNEDWDIIFDVHVKGAQRVTHAAWPHMRDAGYGRVLFTTSAAGLYGNFGQANYSAAKLALVGFANSLAIEGMKRNIQANTIAPIAGSRMTETVLPPELIEALKPEAVSPIVAWLCHEDCEETSAVYEVGGGYHGRVRLERSLGKTFRLGRVITPEDIKNNMDRINDWTGATHPREVMPSMEPVMDNVRAGPSKGGNEHIDVDEALGYEFPPMTTSYDARDVSIYALGVGAAHDPTGDELRYVYEMHPDFAVLPSFAVIPAINTFIERYKAGENAPGLNYGFERILHGEQRTEVLRPMPTSAELTHEATITDIVDKGKNALVVTETTSSDADGPLIKNTFTAVVRGAGGWGGEKKSAESTNVPPDRAPDHVVEEHIDDSAALLYRLSGDVNPLHADPNMAMAFGYEKPILHGLCTYGYAARQVITQFAKGPEYFKAIEVRFADPVYPGETLVTEMWKESDNRIVFRCKVKERDIEVLTRAAVELYSEVPKLAPKPKAAAKVEEKPVAGSAAVFSAIGAYVGSHPELKKIGTVYLFEVGDAKYTVDLVDGKVSEGKVGKPTCNLALSESDFMDMVSGKADPQKLFMGGQLKISGDIMASQKLTFLTEIDPAEIEAAMSANASRSGDELALVEAGGGASPSADVFGQIKKYVENHAELKDINTVFRFELTDPDSAWNIDLKKLEVTEGDGPRSDCTLKLSDAHFMDMVAGKADPQKLFLGGDLKISGDVMASQKLTFLTQLQEEAGASEPEGANVDEILNKMKKPSAAILFIIDGAKHTVGEGDPALTVGMDNETFAELASGGDAKALYMHGKIRVDGDLALARSLNELF